MTDQLRAGIIGVGFMGRVHANAVRAAGGVVTAIAASTRERAERSLADLGAARAAASADELVNAGDVDIVHVCTPNSLHVPLTLGALAAGKHVICEKPLATGLDEARRLATAADGSRSVTAVPFVYRFYPTVREARARIRAGDGGALRLLHGSYLQDWMAAGGGNWRGDPALGGASRAFADIGIHWCDLVEFVSGHRLTRLVSRTVHTGHAQGAGGEDGVTVLFETDRDAVGSVVVSQVTHGRKNRLWFSLDGTAASYSFDQEHPDSLWIGGQSENQVVHRGTGAQSAQAARYSALPPGHPQGYQDCFNAFVADAYAAVGGAPPDGLPTFDDGLRAAALTHAVLRSADEGGWVEVPR